MEKNYIFNGTFAEVRLVYELTFNRELPANLRIDEALRQVDFGFGGSHVRELHRFVRTNELVARYLAGD
jgi:hypothetical protein